MAGALNIAPLLEEALAIANDEIELEDVDLEGLDDTQALERLEGVYESRKAARLEAFLERSGDKLMALRYVRSAALARSALIEREIGRLRDLARRSTRFAEFIGGSAEALLRAEREVRGDPTASYSAKLSDGSRLTLTVRSSTSVYLDPELVADLPEALLRRPSPEPRKIEIKAALERGDEIPGCKLVERTAEYITGWGK